MSDRPGPATQDQAKARFAASRPYVEEHLADYGDRWVEWEGEDCIPVLGFARNVDQHRAAIDPHIRVVEVPEPTVVLQPLRGQAQAFADDADGIELSTEGIEIRRGCVLLEVLAVDRATGLAFQERLRDRFGSLVQADVVADALSFEQVTGFSAWQTDDAGRRLTVHWVGGAGEERHVLELDERPDAVHAQVRAQYTNHVVAASAQAMSVSGELAAPLDGRRVVDATTGEERPSGHGPPEMPGLGWR